MITGSNNISDINHNNVGEAEAQQNDQSKHNTHAHDQIINHNGQIKQDTINQDNNQCDGHHGLSRNITLPNEDNIDNRNKNLFRVIIPLT